MPILMTWKYFFMAFARGPVRAFYTRQATRPRHSVRGNLFAQSVRRNYGMALVLTKELAGTAPRSMTKQPLTNEQLTELTEGLHKLAQNLWWTWDQEAQDIFQELSPRGWQNLYHNAVAILREVSDYELRVRLQRSEERRVGKECRSRWSPY